MGFSQRRRAWEEQRQLLEDIRVKRAREAADALIRSESFNLSALTLPDAQFAVDSLVETAVKAVCDPVNEFLDVLRAKGFRQAEIRKIVIRIYDSFCRPLNDSGEHIYEEMLEPVAIYMAQNQELYAKIDIDFLRS